MRRVHSALLGALLAAGCAVGPHYNAPPIPAASLDVPRVEPKDSLRVFFDSLKTERRSDTQAREPAVLRTVDVAWLDILKDSALTHLVDLAIKQNPDLENTRARIREFRALVGVSRSALLPSLAVNASAGRSQIVVGNLLPTESNAFRVTADVAWELDMWGKTRRAVQASQADVAAEEAAEKGTILSLVSDVALGYLQLLELDREYAIAQQTLTSRRATLALARQRYEQGLTSELDVRQFEAQLAVPAVRIAQVEQGRAIQENALSALIGQTPGPIARGRSLNDASIAVSIPDSLSSSLLSRRPDVQEAERDLAAANARIGVAQAARLPAVAIVSSLGTQAGKGNDLFSGDNNIYQFQSALSLQLFSGGRRTSEVSAANARADESGARFRETSIRAFREASDAMALVRGSRDQVVAQQTQTFALRRALELAEIRYRAGASGYLEVLDAQRSLFDAELALSQSQLRELSAAVQLYKALGGSWNR